ncbi:MAG: Na+/H+ antiporter NhaA, partial [Eggerthellaceae bacterium]|nr:Na+/H+ antiporter NhaA [Eggerthellaceae bacterium]
MAEKCSSKPGCRLDGRATEEIAASVLASAKPFRVSRPMKASLGAERVKAAMASSPSEKRRHGSGSLAAANSRAALFMLLAALASLVIANTDAYEPFHAFWATPVLFGFAGEGSAFSPGEMVNKLLMTVFFFMMGLRIRNELRASTLSGVRTMAIPLFAAVGGLVLPIAFYLLACTGNPEASAGWAIPTATGIAFAIGVMALLGERVTEDTHAFLNSTALAGDIATVFIIAFFYTKNLSVLWIALTLAIIGVLLFLNKARVTSFVPYAVLGLGLWYCVLRSGFHPTMAGVVLAFTLPGNVPGGQEGQTMLQELQRRLFPLVFYVIVPLFAFSNGDVRLAGSGVAVMISSPVFLGTLLGLLLGKPLGIALFAA